MYKVELFYHVVLVSKYRYTLTQKEWNNIKLIIKTINKLKVIEMEQDKNHIHLLISFKPKFSLSQIIKEIKQITTYYVNPIIYKGTKHILWSNGYYASTIGNVNVFKIKDYIKNQNA